jgi:hypothetical protein
MCQQIVVALLNDAPASCRINKEALTHDGPTELGGTSQG